MRTGRNPSDRGADSEPSRKFKKSVQQGRRRIETGGGTDRTSWGRSPVQWILANGKTPLALPISENLNQYVEDFDELRTKLADFFSSLSLLDACLAL